MALSIISNQAASIATRSLGQSNDAATATAEKLSSGKRVNSAKDDAAASAIAARLSAEIAGLQQASVNAGQGSSLLQIADGAFQNVEDILTRAKSLSVQAGSDQISDTERGFLDQEFQALKTEIDRIANDTEFNGSKLVDGEISAMGITNFVGANGVEDIQFQGIEFDATGGGAIGSATADVAYATAMNTFMVTINTTGGGTLGMGTATLPSSVISGMDITRDVALSVDLATTAGGEPNGQVAIQLDAGLFNPTTALADSTVGFSGGDVMDFTFKVGTGVVSAEDEITVGIGSITTDSLGISNNDITSKSNADLASQAVSSAIDALQQKRSEVGAAQNRLDFAAQNVELTRENQEAARSELEDLNVAKAITEFSQQQLLVQAGTSTLSQANSLPQNLLQLFR